MAINFGTVLVMLALVAVVVIAVKFVKAHWSSITHVAGVAMLVICAAWAISANWDAISKAFERAPNVIAGAGDAINESADTLINRTRK